MSLSKKSVVISRVIAVFVAVMIFIVSSMSLPQLSGSFEINIKPILYHVSVFFFLSVFFMISVKRKFIPFATMLLVLYAVLDEVHQLFVPGRVFSVLDMAWDSLGILYACFVYAIRTKHFKNTD